MGSGWVRKGSGVTLVNPHMKLLKNVKFSNFSKIGFVGLGVFWMPKAIFWKFSKSLETFQYFSYISYFHTTSTLWDIRCWILLQNAQKGQPFRPILGQITILGQKQQNSDVFWPKFLHVGARIAPKFFPNQKNSNVLPKKFWWCRTHFWGL